MSTGTRAKAWRECRDINPSSITYKAMVHGWSTKPNATVIPDGAPIPLPADVRRVLRAAEGHVDWHREQKTRGVELWDITRAVDARRSAEKRRKAGGR